MQAPAFRRWLPRFSIRQLLLATTFVAVGCYALRWASPWWAIALFYVSVLAILAAVLIAINRPGAQRSFWSGFAACGLAHLLLVFHPGLENGIPSLHPAEFVTTWLSAYSYQHLKPGLEVNPIAVSPDEIMDVRGHWGHESSLISSPNGDHFRVPTFSAGEDGRFRAMQGTGPHFVLEQDFVEVSHGLWTLLLAYLGGCISAALYRGRQAQTRETADGTESADERK
jgi:hypothetical protein